MSHFKENCEKYFGTTNLYEVLEVSKDASLQQIKKAYHKLSLVVHPDRVDANQKLVATEKFKVLGKIHSILQDEEKRKVYDECGRFDDDDDKLFFNEPSRKREKRHRNPMDDIEGVAEKIRQKASSSFMNMISGLEAKYGGGNKRKSLTAGKTTAKKRKTSRK